jgi:hypothetical protein
MRIKKEQWNGLCEGNRQRIGIESAQKIAQKIADKLADIHTQLEKGQWSVLYEENQHTKAPDFGDRQRSRPRSPVRGSEVSITADITSIARARSTSSATFPMYFLFDSCSIVIRFCSLRSSHRSEILRFQSVE